MAYVRPLKRGNFLKDVNQEKSGGSGCRVGENSSLNFFDFFNAKNSRTKTGFELFFLQAGHIKSLLYHHIQKYFRDFPPQIGSEFSDFFMAEKNQSSSHPFYLISYELDETKRICISGCRFLARSKGRGNCSLMKSDHFKGNCF